MYEEIRVESERVEWRKLFFDKLARPGAQFICWLGCHARFATKDRLQKMGILTDGICCFCDGQESMEHMFLNVLLQSTYGKLSYSGFKSSIPRDGIGS